MTPDEFRAEIDRLKKEVEYWKDACNKLKNENEALSLDLGIKEQDFVIADSFLSKEK